MDNGVVPLGHRLVAKLVRAGPSAVCTTGDDYSERRGLRARATPRTTTSRGLLEVGLRQTATTQRRGLTAVVFCVMWCGVAGGEVLLSTSHFGMHWLQVSLFGHPNFSVCRGIPVACS